MASLKSFDPIPGFAKNLKNDSLSTYASGYCPLGAINNIARCPPSILLRFNAELL